jgi:hypothetical protein
MVMIYNVEDLGSPHTAERLALHQSRLNELAIEGWELIAVAGSVVYLRQDSADAGKPPIEDKPERGKPAGTESGTGESDKPESRGNAHPEGGRHPPGRTPSRAR